MFACSRASIALRGISCQVPSRSFYTSSVIRQRKIFPDGSVKFGYKNEEERVGRDYLKDEKPEFENVPKDSKVAEASAPVPPPKIKVKEPQLKAEDVETEIEHLKLAKRLEGSFARRENTEVRFNAKNMKENTLNALSQEVEFAVEFLNFSRVGQGPSEIKLEIQGKKITIPKDTEVFTNEFYEHMARLAQAAEQSEIEEAKKQAQADIHIPEVKPVVVGNRKIEVKEDFAKLSKMLEPAMVEGEELVKEATTTIAKETERIVETAQLPKKVKQAAEKIEIAGNVTHKARESVEKIVEKTKAPLNKAKEILYKGEKVIKSEIPIQSMKQRAEEVLKSDAVQSAKETAKEKIDSVQKKAEGLASEDTVHKVKEEVTKVVQKVLHSEPVQKTKEKIAETTSIVKEKASDFTKKASEEAQKKGWKNIASDSLEKAKEALSRIGILSNKDSMNQPVKPEQKEEKPKSTEEKAADYIRKEAEK